MAAAAFLLLHTGLMAQNFSLSGRVTDAATGEILPGANVVVRELNMGATANAYGHYSLSLPKGTHVVNCSFVGYSSQTITIEISQNSTQNWALQYSDIMTDEVVVVAEKDDQNVTGVEIGTVELRMEEVQQIPVLMGEVDIMKTIQLLPGISSSSEGNSGFHVRGGSQDQNLILLDDAVIYNPSHLLGFVSIFNGDALRNAEIIKGGIPARYGGRISSVLDVRMRDGNYRDWQVQGGIGLISSRVLVEGPLVPEKSSLLFSARRTYIDLLLEPILEGTENEGNSYFFYDLNLKLNYRLSDKDQLFISGYYGYDKFSYRSPDSDFQSDIPWGNGMINLRWMHLFTGKFYINTSVSYTDYQFNFESSQEGFYSSLFSGIKDWNAKLDANLLISNRQTLRFGAQYTHHRFSPSNAYGRSGDTEFVSPEQVQKAHEGAVYVEEEWKIGSRITAIAGLRYSAFQFVGPFERFVKNEQGVISDTISYSQGESIKTYGGLEPRVGFNYLLTEESSIKAGVTRNMQYIHLVNISNTAMPTDLWLPSSEIIAPQIGWQYSAGYFRNFQNNLFETSVELFYKQMDNLIEYREGTDISSNIRDNPDNNMTTGYGQSYGLELLVRKSKGKTTGWIAYTWSVSERFFDEINKGKSYYAPYDKRHDLSMTGTHELNDRWTVAAVWVFTSGQRITAPKSRYLMDENIYIEWGDRNATKLPAYHRLDVSATWQHRKTNKFDSSFTFAIYNVYNRLNPYFIYYDEEGALELGNYKVTAKQVTLFPILPSITWNFKFL